mmetsp:Transcript_11046/g.25043  ORF Transcript_11046/g.25043 Transcript_11046/m.25043 type:complete len:299 (+) Transcript_11046:536-1432(+)
MWRNLSCVMGAFSPQLPQLAIQDWSSTKRPYLIQLADPDGDFIRALARFQRRICVTMKEGDAVIPAASGALWGDKSWCGRTVLPQGTIAGWGYEAVSFFASSCAPPLGDGSSWDLSADRTCAYPRAALEGLLSLDWTRIVVNLQLPKATVHVFLLAKEKDQSGLERTFSCECVSDLCKLVAEGQDFAQAQERSLWLQEKKAPCWVRTVNGSPCLAEECIGQWTVATEEGPGNVRCYAFEVQDDARYFFNSFHTTSRILFDDNLMEQGRAGANLASFYTIRTKFLDECRRVATDALVCV